jgi:ADP-ribose pyrophosphatase
MTKKLSVNTVAKSRLPKQAKQVFTGEIFDAFQWDQKMYDGSSAVFEMLRRPDTCVVLATTKKGKILLMREAQPTKPMGPSFPGGRIEQGEAPLLAAKRELLEETGYQADQWELAWIEQPVSKIDWNVYIFSARGAHKVAKPTPDAGEKITVKEITFEQFLKLADAPALREPQLKLKMVKARYDKAERAKLKKLLFG